MKPKGHAIVITLTLIWAQFGFAQTGLHSHLVAKQQGAEVFIDGELFKGRSYLKNVGLVTKPETIESVAQWFAELNKLASQSQNPQAIARDVLQALVVVTHPQEVFVNQDEDSDRLLKQAQVLINEVNTLKEYASRDVTEIAAQYTGPFHQGLSDYRACYSDFAPKQKSLMIGQMIDAYVRIEAAYLDAIARPDVNHQDFAEGFFRQMANLQGKIERLGKEEAKAELLRAREQYAQERHQSLEGMRFSDLYHYRALDPEFKLRFVENGPATQLLRQRLIKALTTSPHDSALLVAAMQGLREKMLTIKPLQAAAAAQVKAILNDEALACVCGEPHTQAGWELLRKVVDRLTAWGSDVQPSAYQQLYDSAPAGQGFAEVVAKLHDEADRLRMQFINAMLDMATPATYADWEKTDFDRQVKEYKISLPQTQKLAAKLVKESSSYGVSEHQLLSPHGGAWLIVNFILDLVTDGRLSTDKGFPETLTRDRMALVQIENKAKKTIYLYSIMQIVHAELRKCGAGLDEADVKALAAVQRGALISEQEKEAMVAALAMIIEDKAPERDPVQALSLAKKAVAVASQARTPLRVYLQGQLVVTIKHLLLGGRLSAPKGGYLTKAFAEEAGELADLIRPILQHNLRVHGERYQQILSLSVTRKQLELVFGLSDKLDDPSQTVFDKRELSRLQKIRAEMEGLSRVLSGLTIVRQAVVYSSLFVDEKSQIRDDELLAYAERFGVLEGQLAPDTLHQRLSRMLTAVMAERNISDVGQGDGQEGIDKQKIDTMLRRGLEHGRSFDNFYRYFWETLMVAAQQDNLPLQSRTLARHFSKRMDQLFSQFSDLMVGFKRRQGRDYEVPAVLQLPVQIRAGRDRLGS